MGAPQHYLVSFSDVKATVGGYDISSIVEVQINANANDIPSITLLVDAGHSGAVESEAADAMSLSGARAVLDDCRAMVKKAGSTLSLSFTVNSVGKGGGDTQKFSVSGWLLTDVSLSPIQESGVCTVALTFMHPICKSHFGGIVPGLLSAPLKFTGLSGSNPLDVFLSALRIYGEEAMRNQPRSVKSVPGASDPLTVRDNLITRLQQATESLAESVTWTGGGLPAESQLASWAELLKYGLTIYAMPSQGTSVFQRFAKLLVPECSLALGGDYTSGQLSVGPFVPWDDASMTIKDSDIISLQFPQSDPSPLSGVKLTSNDTADTIPCSYHIDASQTNSKPADIFYVPDSEIEAEFLYGPIQQFHEPGWLSTMKAYMVSKSDSGKSDVQSAKTGKLQLVVKIPRNQKATFSGSSGSQTTVDYSSAMLACAKAYYETSLMKDWAFTINTRLMFNSGGIICPGKVVAVQSDAGEAIAGYVTGVSHAISATNRTARTSITCTHPRFGALPDGISSITNALYS